MNLLRSVGKGLKKPLTKSERIPHLATKFICNITNKTEESLIFPSKPL